MTITITKKVKVTINNHVWYLQTAVNVSVQMFLQVKTSEVGDVVCV